MRKRIAVLGCGMPQLGLLRWLRAEGYEVVGVDGAANPIGRVVCDEYVELSFAEVDAVVVALQTLAVDAVVTGGSDLATRLLPRIAGALGLFCPYTEAQVPLFTDKEPQKRRFRESGVPTAPGVTAEARDGAGRAALEAAALELGLPVVVKPADQWGQRGVRHIKYPHELSPAIETAATTSPSGRVIVERFLLGSEVSVNAVTANGRTEIGAITERISTEYPQVLGIMLAEVVPSGWSEADLARCTQVAVAAIDAVGLKNGPSYLQLRVTPDGPAVVELAARFGGGLDPNVCLLATGWNQFRLATSLGLGEQPSLAELRDPGPYPPAVRAHFMTAEAGRVRSVEGLEQARRMAGILEAEVYVGSNDTVRPLLSGAERVGHVLAVADSRAEVDARASAAAGAIRIVTGA